MSDVAARIKHTSSSPGFDGFSGSELGEGDCMSPRAQAPVSSPHSADSYPAASTTMVSSPAAIVAKSGSSMCLNLTIYFSSPRGGTKASGLHINRHKLA